MKKYNLKKISRKTLQDTAEYMINLDTSTQSSEAIALITRLKQESVTSKESVLKEFIEDFIAINPGVEPKFLENALRQFQEDYNQAE